MTKKLTNDAIRRHLLARGRRFTDAEWKRFLVEQSGREAAPLSPEQHRKFRRLHAREEALAHRWRIVLIPDGYWALLRDDEVMATFPDDNYDLSWALNLLLRDLDHARVLAKLETERHDAKEQEIAGREEDETEAILTRVREIRQRHPRMPIRSIAETMAKEPRFAHITPEGIRMRIRRNKLGHRQ